MMTQAERDDIRRLIVARQKAMKLQAGQRSAELLANFENEMASEFSFDDDQVWAAAAKAAQAEVAKAQKKIDAKSRKLGIPQRFAPGLQLSWRNRGYDNMVAARRAELRRVAKTRIEAIQAEALVQIEISTVAALEQLVLVNLTSDAARRFIEKLPGIKVLMQPLSYAAIAGPADPPVTEQLLTPNALRQQRYRDRQKTLRNAEDVTALPKADDTGGEA